MRIIPIFQGYFASRRGLAPKHSGRNTLNSPIDALNRPGLTFRNYCYFAIKNYGNNRPIEITSSNEIHHCKSSRLYSLLGMCGCMPKSRFGQNRLFRASPCQDQQWRPMHRLHEMHKDMSAEMLQGKAESTGSLNSGNKRAK